MTEAPILIVGAGPTGLLLAIELARREVEFELIDRHPEPLGWDRATVVKARTLEILDALELAQEFLDRGLLVDAVDVVDRGRTIGSFGQADLDLDLPWYVSIPENETEEILTARLGELGVAPRRGVEFVGLEQHPKGVRATLRSQDGDEQAVEAQWLIGTDGFHSDVRHAVDDAFDGSTGALRWCVVDAHISNWKFPPTHVVGQLEAPRLIPIPLADGRFRIYLRLPEEDADPVSVVNAGLPLISAGSAMVEPDEPSVFQTHSRVARRFRAGRVLLAGDAAHACSPIAGHGMNMGLQDAFNLGWKLALVHGGHASAGLLDSYEAERRPVDTEAVTASEEAEVRFAPLGPDEIADLGRRLADPAERHRHAHEEAEIGLGYADSPIVLGEATAHGARPGFRLGDIPGLELDGTPGRLHEHLRGAGHTLLACVGETDTAASDEALTAVRSVVGSLDQHVETWRAATNQRAPRPGERQLHDPDGALHDLLGAQKPTLALVRPDGHLGLLSDLAPPVALRSYLELVFRPA